MLNAFDDFGIKAGQLIDIIWLRVFLGTFYQAILTGQI